MISDAPSTLVSCIMPTYNRRAFVPQAITYFLRQDYEHKELLIVDDGDDPVEDLVPKDERIRYLRLSQRATVGAKRNTACEHARGEVIAHWDDDDWYAPHRLRHQIEALLRTGADISGVNNLLFYDIETRRAWQYFYPAHLRPWLAGSSLCYTRAFWQSHRFANTDVGEDAHFVWSSQPERLTPLPDSTFLVAIIHNKNVSPKHIQQDVWQPRRGDDIQRLMGTDWDYYSQGLAASSDARTSDLSVCAQEVKPVRNIYACLVHESPECIVDLVRNLSYHDPSSVILLYNGSDDPQLLNHDFPYERYGAVLHPSSQRMNWGYLHGFALDCMEFALDNFSFDTITIVDSDQLIVRPGYSNYLGHHLSPDSGVGMLGNYPSPQPPTTQIRPALQAWAEFELWRPFLQRFPQGEEKFVHWTYWPSTVFTSDASHELVGFFKRDEQLQELMQSSKIWATEEIILPTLVALLGYQIIANPCSYDYVNYRASYRQQQIELALNRADIFWVHPVTRCYGDNLRKYLRGRFNHYQKSFDLGAGMQDSITDSAPQLLLPGSILARMRKIEGWLEDDEADLLIAAAARALSTLPEPHILVEVGSYCGRSTVVLGSVAEFFSPQAKVYAIDPHDGIVGALDQGVSKGSPTLDIFTRNIAEAGLSGIVETIPKYSFEVTWDKPVSLLLIDGLHDYANVARDFFHFEKWVVDGGYIAFHDYADYYPGVKTFVDEILHSGRYRKVHCERSMMVVQKVPLIESGMKDS